MNNFDERINNERIFDKILTKFDILISIISYYYDKIKIKIISTYLWMTFN